MELSYYTIDDLRLGKRRLFHKGWKVERFQTFEEARIHYRDLPATGRKMLGLTDGVHVLELVCCLPLFWGDESGEDVLASDYRDLILWRDEPEAANATGDCIDLFHLRYVLEGDIVTPIPTSEKLPKDLMDKYLVPLRRGELASAIRWAYVAGKGWVPPSRLTGQGTHYPLVLKYRVDCITERGCYLSLEVAPWEYQLLADRTQERLDKMK